MFINICWSDRICKVYNGYQLSHKIQSLDKRILWLTQSSTFSESQKIPPINSLFKAFRISLVNWYVALSVFGLVLKPYCSLYKILWSVRCCNSLVCVTFSKVLKRRLKLILTCSLIYRFYYPCLILPINFQEVHITLFEFKICLSYSIFLLLL